MLLIGTLPAPITTKPLVYFVYAVLILLVASALASALLRSTLYALGAFAASMVLVALLYLTIAPFLLFAVQLLVFTSVSAALLIGVLRGTAGLRAAVGPFSRQWIIGGAVAAALLALLGVVLSATSWPVRICCSAMEDFGQTLTSTYLVGLATVIVLLASAALGTGLLLASAQRGRRGPTLRSPRGGGSTSPASSRGGGSTGPGSSRAGESKGPPSSRGGR